MPKISLVVGMLVISLSPASAQKTDLSELPLIEVSRYPNIICNPQGAATLRLNDERIIEFSKQDQPVKCLNNALVSKGKASNWVDWIVLGQNALQDAGLSGKVGTK